MLQAAVSLSHEAFEFSEGLSCAKSAPDGRCVFDASLVMDSVFIGIFGLEVLVRAVVYVNVIDFEADRSACSCAYNRRILTY